MAASPTVHHHQILTTPASVDLWLMKAQPSTKFTEKLKIHQLAERLTKCCKENLIPPTCPPLPSHLSLPGHAGHQGKRVKQKRINSLQKHAIMIIMIRFSIDLLPKVAYSIPLLNKPFQYLEGKTSLSI